MPSIVGAVLVTGFLSGAASAVAEPLPPTPSADQLNADLAVSVPVFGTKTHQINWVAQDGRWKLSNSSACVIATEVAGTDCGV
jgi:hypothetical protein